MTSDDRPPPRPDYAQVRGLTRLFAPGDLVEICALSAGRIDSVPVRVGPGFVQEIVAWAVPRSAAGANLYFCANPLRPWRGPRPSKADLAAVSSLFIDLDPQFGKTTQVVAPWNRDGPPPTLAEEHERMWRHVQGHCGLTALPAPALVVFSGGGYQCFYRLAQPFGPELFDAAQARQRHLCLVAGGDRQASNLLQLARLPGFVNWPDDKKAARGRVPALAHVVYPADLDAPVVGAALTAFPEPVEIPDLRSAHRSDDAISFGPDDIPDIAGAWDIQYWCDSEVPAAVLDYLCAPGTTYDGKSFLSRSEAEMACLVRLFVAGAEPRMVAALLTDERHPLSARSRERRGCETPAGLHAYVLLQINKAWSFARYSHPRVRRFSARYAAVRDFLGKFRVVEFTTDPRKPFRAICPRDFEDSYRASVVEQGQTAQGNPKLHNAAKLWLDSVQPYDTAEFRPGEHDVPETVLNLWAGWPDLGPPRGGGYALFLGHLRENICADDADAFAYLWRWMAHMIQHPAEPGQVAVVLRGNERGTGKTKVFEVLQRIIGPAYARKVSKASDVTGRFNVWFQHTILACAEEAFLGGHAQNQGILNDLITSSELAAEGKGLDKVWVPSCLHWLILSNSEWVVPVGEDERRYLILEVAQGRRRDYDFFAKLDVELEAGGYAALLDDLRRTDLTGFNVREAPATLGLRRQKELSMSPLDRWLLAALESGSIADFPLGKAATLVPSTVVVNDLIAFFVAHTRRDPAPDARAVNAHLARFGVTVQRVRVDRLRAHVAEALAGARAGVVGGAPLCVPAHPAWERWDAASQVRAYQFPPLAHARAAFNALYQSGDHSFFSDNTDNTECSGQT